VDFRVSLVGDGPLRGELEESCERLGLSGRVSFLGARTQDEVMALLARAHLFAAPSVTGRDGDEEGIPTTLMEAMAVGLPVVATRHAGIPELVEDGVSGLLVGERDVDALAGALRTVLADPRRGVEMGAAGRARVASRFDAAATDARTVDLYRELIYGPGLERLTLAN
jgi:colanic acid/amylovoran biosynthesis glycosyltransferase